MVISSYARNLREDMLYPQYHCTELYAADYQLCRWEESPVETHRSVMGYNYEKVYVRQDVVEARKNI